LSIVILDDSSISRVSRNVSEVEHALPIFVNVNVRHDAEGKRSYSDNEEANKQPTAYYHMFA